MKKPSWINNIKVLIWDLDGTLYQELPEIKKEIHQNVIKAIVKTKSISFKKGEELYSQVYAQVKSNTKTLINLGVDKDYVLSGNWYNQAQLKYLKKDPDLVKVFKQLSNLRHIIDTNSNKQVTFKKLKILGLDLNFFGKIFTSTDMGDKVKPDPFAFKIVLQFTKLRPQEHLFIGDSEGKEIIPAQKIGMKTCLVWGKSEIANISLPTVYDIVELFQ